jgi:Alginate export
MLELAALLALTAPAAGTALPATTGDDRITVNLDGVLRSRAEIYDGKPFGLEGPGDDEYILWRALASAEVRFRPEIAVHVQLGWHQQSGRDGGPAPTDKGDFDIRKAYVEITPWDGGQIRLGRQELSFGSSRLVSARDGPNLRRVFDGAFARVEHGRLTGQAFIVRPVDDRPGAFDDRADQEQRFGGIYLTRADDEAGLDLYFFDLYRESSRFGSLAATEKRKSLGARLFGRYASLDYNFEGVAQWGRFGNRAIDAWTLASDTGLTFKEVPLSPRFGLKLNVTSGDSNAADGKLETFNPLFPNLSYFNDAALLAPQNHIDVHPSLSFMLAPELRMGVGVNWFWKTARADDVYRGPGIPTGAEGNARYVGRQIDANLQWQPRPDLEIRASYVRFDIGDALRALSGSDTDFMMISILSRF